MKFDRTILCCGFVRMDTFKMANISHHGLDKSFMTNILSEMDITCIIPSECHCAFPIYSSEWPIVMHVKYGDIFPLNPYIYIL